MPEISRFKAKRGISGRPILMPCSYYNYCRKTPVPQVWEMCPCRLSSHVSTCTTCSHFLQECTYLGQLFPVHMLTKACTAFARFISFQNYCPGLFIHKQKVSKSTDNISVRSEYRAQVSLLLYFHTCWGWRAEG